MGLAGTLIGLAIFVIVIMLFVTFFSTFIDNVFAYIEEFEQSQLNKSKNRSGSTVCDLRFEFFYAFDEAPFGFDFETKQRLYLGIASPNSGGGVFHPEVAVAEFKNCDTKQSGVGYFFQIVSPRLTLDKVKDLGANTLAFTNLTDLNFEIKLKFVRTDDGTVADTQTVRVFQKSLTKLPQRGNEVRIVDNIELNNYDVEISCSGDCGKVNNLATGEDYIFKIRI